MKSSLKSLVVIVALSLFFCFTANAQNKSAGINLSVFNNLSTQPYDTLQHTYCNIGLISKINKMSGVSINGLMAKVMGSSYGLQVAGIANTTKGNVNGLQIGGISNITGGNASGVVICGTSNVWGGDIVGIGIGGLSNITGNESKGLLIAGLSNVTGNKTTGIEIAGLANISGDGHSVGLKIAGVTNVVKSTFTGVEITGLTNYTKGDFCGVQVSGLANFNLAKTTGIQITGINNLAVKLDGMQIAGIYNVVKGNSNGLQIAPLNIANDATNGIQVGLVNYSKTSSKAKFGLVNINPDTQIQLMVFGGNTNKANIAVRFKNRLFYTILGVGNNYLGWNDKFSYSSFYRTGMWMGISKRLSLSSDIGFLNIENLKNKDDVNIPARLYALQFRGNIEYKVSKGLSIFGSTGYSVARYYNRDKTYSQKPIIELGVALF